MNPRHPRSGWATALAPLVIALVQGPLSRAAAPEEGTAEEDPKPPNAPLRLDLPVVTTQVGEEFEARLQAHTESPLGVFALRVEAAPAQIRLRSWSFGEGIRNHIALHGEPPACDVIIYPDGSRLFAVMVMDPPFSSQDYGSECLILRFIVEAERPSATCILYSGDTPDYEPGDDLLTVMNRMRPERRCAPVFIAGAPSIRRGDADGDARRNITDAIRILEYLFLGGRGPDCADVIDTNDDGLVNVSDCVLLLRILFQGTEPPWNDCGADRSQDSLPVCTRDSC